jgi:hypothetical protein
MHQLMGDSVILLYQMTIVERHLGRHLPIELSQIFEEISPSTEKPLGSAGSKQNGVLHSYLIQMLFIKID